MAGGRHGQWPPSMHPGAGTNSNDSSPSNSGSINAPTYIDSAPGGYRSMNHNRFASAGQPGYPPHLPPAGSIPNRNLHSAPHSHSHSYGGPSSIQQHSNGSGMHQTHVEPSVFADPRYFR